MAEATETKQEVVKEVKESKAKSQNLSISLEDLQAIVTAAVSAAAAANAQVVAEAVVEAKKPVPDTRREFEEEQMRQSSKLNRERQAEALRLSQESCPHRQGSNALSSYQGPLSSFVIHYLDTGIAVAICTNCSKVIWGDTQNPEERRMFRDKSGNHASAAGQRMFLNPQEAMKSGR